MSSNKDFNVAAQGTDAQKVRFESEQLDHQLRKVQTPELRKSLQDLKFKADVTLENMEEQLEAERERIAQYIIDQRVAPHPELNLKPDGARGSSDLERRNSIRKAVSDKFEPEHKKQVKDKKEELYSAVRAEVEQTLKDEMELRKGSAATNEDRAISEAKSKLAKMKENARDITQRLDRSKGLGRGRSR
ncbi:MAG: hypothetical protein AAF234_13565 [Pseudomonadota bacterium]